MRTVLLALALFSQVSLASDDLSSVCKSRVENLVKEIGKSNYDTQLIKVFESKIVAQNGNEKTYEVIAFNGADSMGFSYVLDTNESLIFDEVQNERKYGCTILSLEQTFEE